MEPETIEKYKKAGRIAAEVLEYGASLIKKRASLVEVTEKTEQKIFDLATSIKGFGDIGVHRKEKLEPQEVNMVIYATVRMLNELFK